MQLQQLIPASIAQVVALSQAELLADVSEDFVVAMINKGYHIVERRALWKFSEAEVELTAVPGQREATGAPSDLGVPVSVWSNQLKTELGYHDDRQRFFPQEDTGTVQMYGMWGGDLRFYPLPKRAETFTLRYYRTWPDLIDPTDEPILPETWHDLLIDYASYSLAMRLPPAGDRFLPNSRANPFLENFEYRLEQMVNSDLVMPTWDTVPNYGFDEHVLSLEGEAW